MEINSLDQLNKATETESSFLKLEEGKTKLHIVSKIFGVKEHKVKIKNQERFIICPIAMEQWEAQSVGREADRSLKCPVCESTNMPERRVYTKFMAIAVTEDGKVGLLKKGKTVFGPIATLREEGYDLNKTFVVITTKGQGLDTEYQIIPSKDERELTDAEKEAVLAFHKSFPIEQRTQAMSYENIARKLKGEDPVFDDETGDEMTL